MKTEVNLLKQFNEMYERGHVEKQPFNQYEMVRLVMMDGYKTKGKIFWFAYQLMGYWNIDGVKFFLSYKASTRVCEMLDAETVSYKSKGKLHIYALCDVLNDLEEKTGQTVFSINQ